MRTKIATFALATVVVTGGAVLLGPAFAQAASSDTSTVAGAVGDRVSRLADALKGLVTDGTLTQQQADKVASTLAEQLPRGGPHGRHGGHLSPDTVAQVLGITTDELFTAQRDGKTLAQIAQDQGIAKADLIDRLVVAGEKQLADDVAAGRLTQAQADQEKAELRAEITERVDSTHLHGPHGRGPGGPRFGGDGDGDGSDAPAPSPSAEGSTYTS